MAESMCGCLLQVDRRKWVVDIESPLWSITWQMLKAGLLIRLWTLLEVLV